MIGQPKVVREKVSEASKLGLGFYPRLKVQLLDW